jgi:hypothetical protein
MGTAAQCQLATLDHIAELYQKRLRHADRNYLGDGYHVHYYLHDGCHFTVMVNHKLIIAMAGTCLINGNVSPRLIASKDSRTIELASPTCIEELLYLIEIWVGPP